MKSSCSLVTVYTRHIVSGSEDGERTLFSRNRHFLNFLYNKLNFIELSPHFFMSVVSILQKYRKNNKINSKRSIRICFSSHRIGFEKRLILLFRHLKILGMSVFPSLYFKKRCIYMYIHVPLQCYLIQNKANLYVFVKKASDNNMI